MTKKALLIQSPYSGNLYLEEFSNDLADWYSTLRDYRGFTSFVIANTLESTTVAALLNQLQLFCSGLVKGDRAAIIMIGHGSRVSDLNGDESDYYDECYVCSDGFLVDDSIGQLLALAPSVTVVELVQEICYAGSADHSSIARSLPSRIGIGSGTRPSYYRAWQSCGENQLSYGGVSGGIRRSVFSLYMCWALRSYLFNPANEIMNVVRSYVTSVVPSQIPQLTGSYLDAVPF
jgi:hypothetical protein